MGPLLIVVAQPSGQVGGATAHLRFATPSASSLARKIHEELAGADQAVEIV